MSSWGLVTADRVSPLSLWQLIVYVCPSFGELVLVDTKSDSKDLVPSSQGWCGFEDSFQAVPGCVLQKLCCQMSNIRSSVRRGSQGLSWMAGSFFWASKGWDVEWCLKYRDECKDSQQRHSHWTPHVLTSAGVAK
eukprot:797666-Amphidinium_carterae.1